MLQLVTGLLIMCIGVIITTVGGYKAKEGWDILHRTNSSNNPVQFTIFNPAQTKASLGKAQSIPPNQKTKILFDKEVLDTLNEFDLERHRWTAAKTTLYKIDLRIQIEEIKDKSEILIWVAQNGISAIDERFNISPSLSANLTLIKTLDIKAYDYVDVFIQHNYKENISIISDPKVSYLSIEETDRRI